MRYRGRSFSEEEIKTIKEIIEATAIRKSRTYTSKEICKRLSWLKPDGGLKDMACRVALLQMEKDNVLTLPPCRLVKAQMAKPTILTLDEQMPLTGPLSNFDFKISLVKTTIEAQIWNSYIHHHHYLGYTKMGGAQLRYIVKHENQYVAFFGFSAAAWKVMPRDQYIGWAADQREKNLHLIINNSRFLILPNVKVPHLASHLLGRITKQLPANWNSKYKYKPVLIETFVQKNRFQGTSYKAANWINVGDTKGRGKSDRTHQNNKPIKSIWLYPLTKNLKKLLV